MLGQAIWQDMAAQQKRDAEKQPYGGTEGVMLRLEYDKKQIEEVIHKIVRKTMNMDLTWDWPCGVAYYGISEAYEKTGNEEYLKLLKDRVDELIDLGLPRVWTVNACAMGHCLITLYKATNEQKYYDILMSKIAYISKDALRFADHVLQHTVSANNDFPEQAWCDTLFMAAFLLLRVGVMNKDEDMINDALNQYYWHIKYLQNPSSGFYYHGYDNIAGDHMSGIYWGRAFQGGYQFKHGDGIVQIIHERKEVRNDAGQGAFGDRGWRARPRSLRKAGMGRH